MNHTMIACGGIFLASALLCLPMTASYAQSLPDWIRTTALWYGEEKVSEMEFLNMIQFLINQKVIVIESRDDFSDQRNIIVMIPNGNSKVSDKGFYYPQKIEITKGTSVIWINEDNYPHSIQSIDENGKTNGLFNSSLLETGDEFEYVFENTGIFNYYCSFHPWRTGVISVTV
ncbi:MAG: cupredoxin domain-containing protein [Nitrosopumilus sp.]